MRLREKGGKRHAMPCHHNLEEYLVAYLDSAGLREDAKGPLFRTIGREKRALLTRLNPQTGKPLDEGTLKKHFPREIAVGAAELHARMGSFMVANIFGMTPPAGTQPIKNESSRAML